MVDGETLGVIVFCSGGPSATIDVTATKRLYSCIYLSILLIKKIFVSLL